MYDLSVICGKRSMFHVLLTFAAILVVTSLGAVAQEPDSASKNLVEDQPLVSNIFYETDLREVLMNIADQTGVPIVADQTVRGGVTIAITDLPLEDCLTRILGPLGYTFKKIDDYYLVGTATPTNPSFHLLSTTESIVPNYIKATDVVKLMSSYYQPYVKADEQTNRLTITASPDVIARFKKDLEKIDGQPRQVMIEALVTEISEDNMKEIGLEAFIRGTKDGKTGTIDLLTGSISDSSIRIGGTRLGDSWNGWGLDYQAVIKALASTGMAEIRAAPKLVTQEGRLAKIFIGKDQYYTIATGGSESYVYSRLEVIKVGITLEITPYVSDKDEITVEVKAIVSDVTGMGVTGLPVINTRDVNTRIQVNDGESIVIGGLQSEDNRKRVKKIPILGDIPLIGFLFRNTSTETRKTEIIIVVTPYLLKDSEG
ncbi:MAG: type II secretion system protein GspD [Candidatus Thorarchaeota archaeon]